MRRLGADDASPAASPAPAPTRAIVIVTPATLATQLTDILQAEADISVVGSSSEAGDAAEMVASLRPDVLILDLDRAGGDAPKAIQQIMRSTPTPILVMADEGPDERTDDRPASTAEAVRAGAIGAIPKPTVWTTSLAAEVRRRVRTLRNVTVRRPPLGRSPVARARRPAPGPPPA